MSSIGFYTEQIFNHSPNLIYSLGIRCDAEMSLRRLGLRRISSAVGSFDSRSISTVIHAVSTDYAWIVDKSRLRKSPSNPPKTFISGYLDDFSESNAIAQHHDLSDEKTLHHFHRARDRFISISRTRLPTLFFLSIKSADMSTVLVEDIRLLYSVLKSKFNCSLLVQLYLKDSMTASSFISRNGRTTPFSFLRLSNICLDSPPILVSHEIAVEDESLVVSVCSSLDSRLEHRKIQPMILRSVFTALNVSTHNLFSHELLLDFLGG